MDTSEEFCGYLRLWLLWVCISLYEDGAWLFSTIPCKDSWQWTPKAIPWCPSERFIRRVKHYHLLCKVLRRRARRPPELDVELDWDGAHIKQANKLDPYQYYGSNFDAHVKQINPYQFVQALKTFELIQVKAINTKREPLAMVAFTQTSDLGTVPLAYENQCMSCPTKSYEAIKQHLGKSVYFSQKELDAIPIVLDSGASISITPRRSDFVNDLEPAHDVDLNGLTMVRQKFMVKVWWNGQLGIYLEPLERSALEPTLYLKQQYASSARSAISKNKMVETSI